MSNGKNIIELDYQPNDQNEEINLSQEREDGKTTNRSKPYLETPHFPKDSQSKSSCLFFYKDINSKEEIIKSNFTLTQLKERSPGEKDRCRSFHNPKTKSFDYQIPTNGVLSRELFEKRKSVFEASSNKSILSYIERSKESNSNTSNSSLISDTANPIKLNNSNGKGLTPQEEDKSMSNQWNISNISNMLHEGKANKEKGYRIMRQGEVVVENNKDEENNPKEIIQLSNDKGIEKKRYSYVNDTRLKREIILNIIIIGRQRQTNQREFKDLVQRTSVESCNLNFNPEQIDKDPIKEGDSSDDKNNENCNNICTTTVMGTLTLNNKSSNNIDIRKTIKRSRESPRVKSLDETNTHKEDDVALNRQIDYSKITKRKRCKEPKDYNVFLNNQPTLNDNNTNEPIDNKAEEPFIEDNVIKSTIDNNETDGCSITEQKKTSLSRNNSCCKDSSNDNADNNANAANSNNEYCIMLPNNNDNGLVTFKAEQLETILSAFNKSHPKIDNFREKSTLSTTTINTNYSHNTIDTHNDKYQSYLKQKQKQKQKQSAIRSNYQETQKNKCKTKRLSYEKVQKPTFDYNTKPKPNKKKIGNNNTKSLNKNANCLINQFDGSPIFSYNKDDKLNNLSPHYYPCKTNRSESEQSLFQLLIEIQKKCIDSNASFKQKEDELKSEIEFLKARINTLATREIDYQNRIKLLSVLSNQSNQMDNKKSVIRNMDYETQMNQEDNDIEIKLNMIKSNSEYSKVLNENQSMRELFNYLYNRIEKVRSNRSLQR